MVKSSGLPARSNLDGLFSGYLKGKRLKMILPFIPPGARILDVGCDNGELLERLPDFGRYLGLDSRGNVITRNRGHFRRANAAFVCASLDDFAWKGPPFDRVVMTAVLEHLDDVAPALARLGELTEAGGLLLITTPCPLSRFVLRAGAAIRLFARDSLGEHKHYFRRSDFLQFPGWKLDLYKRFEFGWNQLIVMRKLPAPRRSP